MRNYTRPVVPSVGHLPPLKRLQVTQHRNVGTNSSWWDSIPAYAQKQATNAIVRPLIQEAIRGVKRAVSTSLPYVTGGLLGGASWMARRWRNRGRATDAQVNEAVHILNNL